MWKNMLTEEFFWKTFAQTRWLHRSQELKERVCKEHPSLLLQKEEEEEETTEERKRKKERKGGQDDTAAYGFWTGDGHWRKYCLTRLRHEAQADKQQDPEHKRAPISRKEPNVLLLAQRITHNVDGSDRWITKHKASWEASVAIYSLDKPYYLVLKAAAGDEWIYYKQEDMNEDSEELPYFDCVIAEDVADSYEIRVVAFREDTETYVTALDPRDSVLTDLQSHLGLTGFDWTAVYRYLIANATFLDGNRLEMSTDGSHMEVVSVRELRGTISGLCA